jgi:hypothetical protein
MAKLAPLSKVKQQLLDSTAQAETQLTTQLQGRLHTSQADHFAKTMRHSTQPEAAGPYGQEPGGGDLGARNFRDLANVQSKVNDLMEKIKARN